MQSLVDYDLALYYAIKIVSILNLLILFKVSPKVPGGYAMSIK